MNSNQKSHLVTSLTTLNAIAVFFLSLPPCLFWSVIAYLRWCYVIIQPLIQEFFSQNWVDRKVLSSITFQKMTLLIDKVIMMS